MKLQNVVRLLVFFSVVAFITSSPMYNAIKLVPRRMPDCSGNDFLETDPNCNMEPNKLTELMDNIHRATNETLLMFSKHAVNGIFAPFLNAMKALNPTKTESKPGNS